MGKPKIVIIGAGAAGVSAACRLIKNGLEDVTVLEANDRIGGRIYTKQFADNFVELGAQWVHGEEGNEVYKLASSKNLLESSYNLSNYEKHTFATSRGEVIPSDETIKSWGLYHKISHQVDEDLKERDGSYGDYFISEFWKALSTDRFMNDERAEEILSWMEKFDNSIQCSDSWFEVSAKGLTDYWVCEGDSLLNWKDKGYKSLFDIMMNDANCKRILKDKIKLSKEVSRIDYTDVNNVMISTSDGDQFTATNVIFTASLGVLKNEHLHLFTPSLPDRKQLAIRGLNIGTVSKVFLEFPYRWWPEDSAGFGLLWNKADKAEFLKKGSSEWMCDIFQFFTVDHQPRVLCGWISGRHSKFIETLSDSEVKEGLCDLLDRFLGRSFNIPRPDNILRSKWNTDKHFRGCYSFRSLTTDELNVSAKDLAAPILGNQGKPVILFAGEATHDHFYSTVHGAVETGYREADRLINYYKQLKSHL